jgi:hypothetical protein
MFEKDHFVKTPKWYEKVKRASLTIWMDKESKMHTSNVHTNTKSHLLYGLPPWFIPKSFITSPRNMEKYMSDHI